MKAGIPDVANATISPSLGDSFSMAFPILLPSGVPASFTSPTGVLSLSDSAYATTTPILIKAATLAQRGGVWTATLIFARSDSTAIAFGKHYYELVITDGSNENTVATGVIDFLPTITRP